MRLLHALQRFNQAKAWARQLLRVRGAQPVRPPLPVRLRRAAPLSVGRLEKRIVLDAGGVLSAMGELVITSDAAVANETVTIDSNTDGELQITQLGSPLEIVDHLGAPVTSLDTVTSIDVSLGGGQDHLVVDFHNAPNDASLPSITYHGGPNSDPGEAASDRLSLIGDGTQTAVYSLNTLLPAEGSITVGDPALGSSTITFTGLKPIEITGMSSTLLQAGDSGAGDSPTVRITGEFDLTANGSEADLQIHNGASLSGTGTVLAGDRTASVNLQSGSTLAPGDSPGSLTVANLNLSSGSTFAVEIDDHDANDPLAALPGGIAGVDYDQMRVEGTVTIGTDVLLNLEDLGSTEANPRDVYTIIDNDGTDAVVGRFVDTSNVVLENGGTVTAVGGLQYRIDYNGGDGNDVTLIGIPATRAEVFVSHDFTQSPGSVIADVDFNTAGNQPGILGIDAFPTLEEAIQSVDLGGTVYVDAGTYVHTGTLRIDRSVTIEGQGMGQTELRKAGAPAGNYDEAIRITADNVTLRGMQLGWVDFLANDYQGYVVLTQADHTTIHQVQFGESFGGNPLDDEGYRSAIVFETADHLEVSDSIFEGRWGRATIRDGADGSGENFLITRNEFREDHFRWGPIAIGPQGTFGEPNNFAFSGEISFNYFGNGLDPVDFQSSGDQNHTVTITNQGLTPDGLLIDHNTFDWRDTDTQNQNGVHAQPAGVYINPAFTNHTDQIRIQDNIFYGFAYGGQQPGEEQPTWQPAAGRFDGAIYLDGDGDFGLVQDDRIDIGDSGSFTVWINPDVLGKRQEIAGGAVEFQLRHSNDLYFYPGNLGDGDTLVWSTDTIAADTWTHLAFTWDHASQQGHIYIDGVEVAYRSGYDPDVSPDWTEIVDTMQAIFIGRDPGNPDARDFHGSMDDLAFFDAVLSQTEVQSVMTGGAATYAADARMIAHWDFDQTSGKTAIDNQQGIEMRLVTDGIVPLGPEFVAGAGRFDGALAFDGADDFATFQDATFDVGSSGTLNFWVQMDATDRRNQFFEGPENGGFEMQYRTNGSGQVYGRTSTNGDYVIRSGGDAAVLDSGWHNIQYTWDFATSEMQIYVDGVESTYLSSYTPENLNWTSVADTVNGLMFMGRDASSSDRFFDGMMDDVAWYDTALSTAERDAIRAAGVSTHANLVAHWAFDQAPTAENTYTGDNGTSIVLYLQQLPPAPPIQGSGVITPADAVVVNNAFFANDVDSNQTLDASNITGDDANPFANGDQTNATAIPLAEFYTLRFGSSAAYQSTQFQSDIATTLPHIGAYQGDPIAVGVEDMLIVGTDQDDMLVVTFDGEASGTFVLTTGIGTADEITLGPVSFSDITSITFDSYGGDDVLKIVQPDNGSIDVSGGIYFNAGSQANDGIGNDAIPGIDGDTLILEASPAMTTIDSVHYFFEDEGTVGHVGSIVITDATNNGGLGGSTTIYYDGLEPIFDNLNVDDRSFTFNSSAATETITLSSPGDAVGPLPTPLDNKIVSDNGGIPLSEVVHFNNPNVSMTIHGGDGNQTINVDSLDSDYRAALTINGDDGGTDVVNFNSSLGTLLLGSGSVTGTLAVTAETINIHADVSIDTSGGVTDGDVTFDAVAGIAMHDSSTIAAGDADIRMTSQGDIAISRITSAETVALTTTAGRIIDNRSSDEAANITATSAALRAETGIGSGTAADDADLDLDVSNLAAVTNAGDIHLQNAKELSVETVDGLSGIAVTDSLNNNALGNITIRTAGAFQIAAGTGVLNDDGGDITLAAEGTSIGDSLTIEADVTAAGGSGNIYLLAGDSITVAVVAITATQAGAILLKSGTDFNNGSPQIGNAAGLIALTGSAHVQTDAGHISLLSADSIDLGSDVRVQTADSGTIDLDSSVGEISMDATAILESTDGDIRVSAHGDFTIGDIVATSANVSLISATGSILDADANDSDLDVVAQRLRFNAAVGFGELGTGANAIETSVVVVSGRSTSGGIHLIESDAVTVGDVDAMVYRVSATTVPTAIVDGSQGDLVTTADNGSIVLRSIAGDITLTDGTAAADGNAVVAHGNGNVLISAEGLDTDIVVDADVRSTSGNLSLIAARDLQLGGNVDIQTAGDGTIDVEASTGSLAMDATATLQSVAGDIRGLANNDLTIGDIFATDANVSLTARTGSILDADGDDADSDVTAQGLRLNAGNAVGTLGASSNAIETSVGVVTARAAAGGINLLESDAVTVGDVAITVNRVASDGSVVVVEDAAQSDLVTTADNGSIVLRSLAGDITLTDGNAATDGNAVVAHGSGNVFIAAEGIDTDIVADADVRSTSGNLSLIAAGDLQLNTNVDVQTGTDGTIDVEATTGSLAMNSTATLQSDAGDIRGFANNDLTIGDIVATDANVSLTAIDGSILDADPDDADIDVTAEGLRLNAANGIGTLGASSNAIETSVGVVTARAAAGGINLLESDAVTVVDVAITVKRVTSDTSVVEVIDAAQSDLVTTADNGSIVLRSLAGDITLTNGTAAADGNAVVAHGSGNVLISAEGIDTDIVADADIRSTSGNLSLIAAGDLKLNADVDVQTGTDGTIDVEASTGSLAMDATATLQSVTGDIRGLANNDLTIGDIFATDANVSLTARTGSILDADPVDADIDVTAEGLRLNAGNAVGTLGASSNAIETSVGVVTARAAAGGINLLETDAVTVGDVAITVNRVTSDASVVEVIDAAQNDLVTTADNGSIVLRSLAGDITLTDGTAAADGNAVVADGSGNVLLQTISTTADIVIDASVRSESGHVSINAADDIHQNADLMTGGEGTISLTASNSNDDGVGNDGIVMRSDAQTVSGGGNIRLQAAGESDLFLGLIDAGTGDVSLLAERDVLDNNGSTLGNVRGDALRIVADANGNQTGTIGTSDTGNSIESNDHAIQTAVTTLAAVAADGIYILESDAIAIDHTTDISVQQVGADATVTTITDASLSDLETTDAGPIKLKTLAGTITINEGDADDNGLHAAGLGDVLLAAGGDASDVVINADVASDSGNVSLSAADDIALAADLSTGGEGTVWSQAGNAFAETPAVDGFHMLVGSTITSGADIAIETLGESDLVVQAIDAGTDAVRLSAAGNIIDGNGATLNITAGSVMLIADANSDGEGSIGSPDPSSLPSDNLKAIDIAAQRVAARSADGIYLHQTAGDLTVDTVSVDVNRVHFNSTTSEDSQTLADLETTDSGSIKVVASDGDLTLDDGDDDGIAVSAAGGGDVLLDARGSGNLNINGSVFSGSGQIGLQAQESIELANDVTVQTGGDGTIAIDASLSAGTSGAIAMAAEARVQTVNGDIHIAADQTISVGRIETLANVSITSIAGSIVDTDMDDAAIDVTAAGLRMNALNGVGMLGATANGLETQVATLSARAGNGGVHVIEADGLRIDDVAVQVQRPEFRSTQTTVNDLAQSDLRTTDDGSIVLRSLAGEITLNEGTASAGDGAIQADGIGNVLIAAEGLGSQINANANIVSGVGNISLIAADSIAVAAGVNVTTAANGTIDLEATAGALTMAATATLQTEAGDIRAAAGADLTIGDIVATDADVSLISTGGSILDADPDDADVDVTANRLRLAAAIGVGTATNAIETDVDTLSGRATSGGIQLLETDSIAIDDVEVTVQRVGNDASSTDRTDALQSDLRTTDGDGSIALQTIDGSITLNEGTAASGDGAISADGSGNVQIDANGADSDLIAGADIASGSGAIVIDASRNILLNAFVDVTTAGAGTIDLTATTGNLTMAPTATLQSVAGNITGTAEQDVTIGDITSTMANVILTSQSSQIIDADPAGDSDQDIAAVEAILTAPLGIGVGNAIETSVDVLEAEATTSGTIEIVESDAIELRRVITGDGRIAVTAGGTITATEVQSTNTSSSDAAIGQADSRDIALVANGAASSILVTKITAAAGADVHLTADNDILDTDIDDDNLIFADDLHLIAGNQSDDGDNAVQLTTTINDLQAEVSGSGRGDLEILETDALNLVTSDEATDADMLRTSNGEIRVSAGGSIVLADPDLSNDGGDRTADPEIVAGGDNGRILLQTDADLTIDEGVQIHASQSTAGAVRIAAVGEILLGEQIEINTGASTGVARVFAPRPEEGVTDTAFYDYDTVTTTILASEPGGFGGDLTIDVGTAGERGLAIEIDWGAESNRFQVVDGIDGESMTTVHHTYTEAEILTTTLNGRSSSTNPVEVRFTVRQHESIVLEGASIEQGISGAQIVDGGLVSSTDNPQTSPLLENGEAQFTVPNLSIPTRLFFPPPEYPELVRRLSEAYAETSTLLTTTLTSTETSSVTTTTSRDEYFQIRVISPDPNIESEVPPERLPDDILSGDKLQTLFANLPDGTYEIEYVLGEGNARSILRVEIRQGKPIIPGEDLEGGLLKLKELDLDLLQEPALPIQQQPDDFESTDATSSVDAAEFTLVDPSKPEHVIPQVHAETPERLDGWQDAVTTENDEGVTLATGSVLLGLLAKKQQRPRGGEYSLTRRIVRRFAK
ncbi:hypothetical protein Poly24_45540 [Rosistilla carotiformis]|uniref:LamG-like jellyroll fold domain-containing protein n=1 Tax=Rosistilla carotiformis TaxID=2528017 RepID=A0A518JZ54_9BACT|nr:LamG-like jellyroll fold domain-containing protein [Rosistilla carotiformis]QDV70821.1 hypothetical protein Poly24_45540 [Rosistilla carotiformis]